MAELFAFIFQNSFLLRGIVLLFLGLIIGSFLNVVVYRLPVILKRKWHNESKEHLNLDMICPYDAINLIHPASHCPICKTKIPFWANIPILGYFIVNGRCNHCNTKISVRYPFVELSSGILFAIAGYVSNDVILLPALLVFISFVICLILIDFDTMLLPDELTLSLLWVGLIVNLGGVLSQSLSNAVIGAVVGYVSLWLVYWLFKLATKRDGMGYGDFKFLAAILAWTGYQALVVVLLISSMLGIMYYLAVKLSGKLHANGNISGHIPFGPFLGIAGLIVVLGGKYINLAAFHL
ncbi:MAG: prepilin peptidase [Burkholderiales bacterium]|jgi:leader peptidase (prepilin peptidase)/N-methyltransferase|nr:prepilin peptidase [Burkholderiales bacterium]